MYFPPACILICLLFLLEKEENNILPIFWCFILQAASEILRRGLELKDDRLIKKHTPFTKSPGKLPSWLKFCFWDISVPTSFPFSVSLFWCWPLTPPRLLKLFSGGAFYVCPIFFSGNHFSGLTWTGSGPKWSSGSFSSWPLFLGSFYALCLIRFASLLFQYYNLCCLTWKILKLRCRLGALKFHSVL